MKAFKGLREKISRGEGGFTLIELLIVIIILGILAAVVAFNVAGFLGAGTYETAKTESASVQTAIIAGMAAQSMGSLAGTPQTIAANKDPKDITITDNANSDNSFTLDTYLSSPPHGSWTWNGAGVVTSGWYAGGGVNCTYAHVTQTCTDGTNHGDTRWCCTKG